MSNPASDITPYADALADAIEAALPGWVERCIADRSGVTDPGEVARAAGRKATSDVMPEIRRLLATDIDDQWTSPLELIRGACSYPTAVLREAGIPPAPRDGFAERMFPDDIYDLSPAAFADVDPSLRDPGLAWGAAKAHVHLRRRRG